jgi:hypothetical protein
VDHAEGDVVLIGYGREELHRDEDEGQPEIAGPDGDGSHGITRTLRKTASSNLGLWRTGASEQSRTRAQKKEGLSRSRRAIIIGCASTRTESHSQAHPASAAGQPAHTLLLGRPR